MYWIRGSYRAVAYGNIINVYYDFYDCLWKYQTDPESDMAQLNDKVQEIVDKASKYDTDYEKAEFVHDYLVEHVDYALDELEQSEKTNNFNSKYEYIRTAYGCLVKGRCVCSGYSKAYELILLRMGIPCAYVTGDTSVGYHAWNYVGIDGDDYYCDVTWDDQGVYNDYTVYHDYFCLTRDELEQERTFDEKYFYYP